MEGPWLGFTARLSPSFMKQEPQVVIVLSPTQVVVSPCREPLLTVPAPLIGALS